MSFLTKFQNDTEELREEILLLPASLCPFELSGQLTFSGENTIQWNINAVKQSDFNLLVGIKSIIKNKLELYKLNLEI